MYFLISTSRTITCKSKNLSSIFQNRHNLLLKQTVYNTENITHPLLSRRYHFSFSSNLSSHSRKNELHTFSIGSFNLKQGNILKPQLFSSMNRNIGIFNKGLGKDKDPSEPNKNASKLSIPSEKGYIAIYKFPYIVHVHTLCRMKILQTACFLTLIPVGLISGIGSELTTLLFAGSFALFMLCVMGEVFRKFVGFVYYHPAHNSVCISHLTFWGRRHDAYFDALDVKPLTDVQGNLNDLFCATGLYSDPKKSFWISLKYGKILDDVLFEEIFGSVSK